MRIDLFAPDTVPAPRPRSLRHLLNVAAGIVVALSVAIVPVGAAGAAINLGSASNNVVATVADPVANGLWAVTGTGSVFAFGGAGYFGGLSASELNAPIVTIAPTPDGKGYWLAAADGGIFAFGDASFFGSMGNQVLNQPIVAMAATADGQGYWLAAADGGIFAFGDASFFGSMGNQVLNRPIVGMAADDQTGGYWLVATDGGIFGFNAPFYGSTGAITLNRPVEAMSATSDDQGYTLIATDGGVFNFGDANYEGSTAGETLPASVIGLARTTDGDGYWITDALGQIYEFGDAPYIGTLNPVVATVGDSLAETLGLAMSIAPPPNVTLHEDGIFGCGVAQGAPIITNGTYENPVPTCNGYSNPQWESVYAANIASQAPQVVVLLVGYWETADRTYGNGYQNITDAGYYQYLVNQYDAAITELRQGGARVVLMTCPYFDQVNPGPLAPDGVATNAKVDLWNQIVNNATATLAPSVAAGVSVADLNAQVDPGGQYASSINGVVVRAPDGVHFPFGGSVANANPEVTQTVINFSEFLYPWFWTNVL